MSSSPTESSNKFIYKVNNINNSNDNNNNINNYSNSTKIIESNNQIDMSLTKCNCKDNCNCDDVQKRYLQEATLFFRGIEKPLKYGPIVDTLKDLIKYLHEAFETDYVNIELVNHLMLAYKSNPKEWQKFAKWDRYRYTRNLVDEGNGKFNLMILCWGEGQASAIHDHADSHCFMKMLQGKLVETKYETPTSLIEASSSTSSSSSSSTCDNEDYDQAELKEISVKTLELNEVCYINDQIGLHRVENPSHTDGAVSLHLYCPPFNTCSIYQKNSGKRTICPVTFWSKYGIRQVNKCC